MRGPAPRSASATARPARSRLRQPGTLDHFLIERFCLYSVAPSGTLVRSEIHHAPWPLQPAEAELEANTYTPAGLLLSPDPHVRFSARQDILAWPPEAV